MSRKQVIYLILFFALALGLRLYFIPAPGYERDIQLFKIWSQAGFENGVHNIYDKTWCDYPPAYLYVLKGLGFIYHRFYPSFEEHTYLFDFLMKFPGILADLLIPVLIFMYLKNRFPFKYALLAAAAFAFNPAVIFNSAYWGQVDSITALLTLTAALLLSRNNFLWPWVLLAFTILLKTQAVILLPIFALITYKRKGFDGLIKSLTAAWAAAVVLLLPFFLYHQLDRVFNVVWNAVGEYPFLSMNAYNFWWLASWGQGRWLPDTGLFYNAISYRSLGSILIALFMFLLLKRLWDREKDDGELLLACGLAFFGFFMLPTEMHERYLMPAFPFLLLAAVKRFDFKIIFGALSFTAFFNLFLSLARTYPKNLPDLPLDIAVSAVNVIILGYFIFLLVINLKFKGAAILIPIILAIAWLGLYMNVPRQKYLSDLSPYSYSQQWGSLMKDRSIDGNSPTVGGFIYSKGLGTHANSNLIYLLNGRWRWLEGAVGLDDEQNRGNNIEFIILADDKEIFRSGVLRGWNKPVPLHLPIDGVKELKLVVNDGGDGINFDHADWLDLKVSP